MRVTALLPLAFAAASYAAALMPRDLATIQGAFNSIDAAVTTFDNAVLAISGTPDEADLTAKADAIVAALNDGTATVTATSSVALLDALNLVSSSNTLKDAVDKTITDLTAAKPDFTADQQATVLQQLLDQKAASQTFIAAVVSKVPDSVKSIANTQAQAVITSINRGITAYGGTV
jgi:hypothetical protein